MCVIPAQLCSGATYNGFVRHHAADPPETRRTIEGEAQELEIGYIVDAELQYRLDHDYLLNPA